MFFGQSDHKSQNVSYRHQNTCDKAMFQNCAMVDMMKDVTAPFEKPQKIE